MDYQTNGREQNLPRYGFGVIVTQKQAKAIEAYNSGTNVTVGGTTPTILGGELLATFTPPQIANGNLEIINVPMGVTINKQYARSIKSNVANANVIIDLAILQDGFMQVSITNHTGGLLNLPAITIGALPLT
jgi:hypothetical protein